MILFPSSTVCFQVLMNPTPQRMFVLAAALKAGYTIEKLYDLTKIDHWFLHKFKNIVSLHTKLENLKVVFFLSSSNFN